MCACMYVRDARPSSSRLPSHRPWPGLLSVCVCVCLCVSVCVCLRARAVRVCVRVSVCLSACLSVPSTVSCHSVLGFLTRALQLVEPGSRYLHNLYSVYWKLYAQHPEIRPAPSALSVNLKPGALKPGLLWPRTALKCGPSRPSPRIRPACLQVSKPSTETLNPQPYPQTLHTSLASYPLRLPPGDTLAMFPFSSRRLRLRAWGSGFGFVCFWLEASRRILVFSALGSRV